MIKRIVKLNFKPDNIDAFKSIFETNWQNIKGFEGCSHIELLQDENDPATFFTYSWWQSEAHLNAYRKSELFGRVWPATKALFNDKPQVWTVKALNF